MKKINNDLYYYNTHCSSPLSYLFDTAEFLPWWQGRDNDQYQVKLDQELIFKDEILSKLHTESDGGGVLSLLLLPPNNMYNWHTDFHGLCNFNLINSVEEKYTFFKLDPGLHEWSEKKPSIDSIPSLKPLLKVDVTPNKWCILNPTILHAGINFSNEPKYMVQYVLKKQRSKISYDEAVEIVKSMKSTV